MKQDEQNSFEHKTSVDEPQLSDERRDFLKKCGKFAMYSAPAMAALLLFDRKKAHAFPGSDD